MQNLDQIRSAGALAAKDLTSKQAVSKLPAMIITNGLLAAAAFANETKDNGNAKRGTMQGAMSAIAHHLKEPAFGIDILHPISDNAEPQRAVEQLITLLSSGDAGSLELQRSTAESLAFLAFLKRYAVKEDIED